MNTEDIKQIAFEEAMACFFGMLFSGLLNSVVPGHHQDDIENMPPEVDCTLHNDDFDNWDE